MSTTTPLQSLYPTGFTGQFAFLSNFHPVIIAGDDDITYPSVEHAFHAYKTLDLAHRRAIAALKRPQDAKRQGRLIQPLRPDWEHKKFPIMLHLVERKFRYHELALRLVQTEDLELVEWNTWHDNTWGVCTCKGFCPTCTPCSRLRGAEEPLARGFHDGLNLLGHALSIVRARINDAPELVIGRQW